ncbi:MAG: single-stranded DNA-binding protein [Lachnospiraceae bacterium]|nr:single-stranded DNA-binding protein [Lachnospiraceae bacterium]
MQKKKLQNTGGHVNRVGKIKEFIMLNEATATGKIIKELEYSHKVYNEKFYKTEIKVFRLSKNFDIIPVVISERAIDTAKSYIGKSITVKGQYRSYNQRQGEKAKLILLLFADSIEILKGSENGQNNIKLRGSICREPFYRITFDGKEIADYMLAVNRAHGATDYIPCISWGSGARTVSKLSISSVLEVEGRIQCRKYIKKHKDGTIEEGEAYEVSCSKIIRKE